MDPTKQDPWLISLTLPHSYSLYATTCLHLGTCLPVSQQVLADKFGDTFACSPANLPAWDLLDGRE